jgi:hypothetical protein
MLKQRRKEKTNKDQEFLDEKREQEMKEVRKRIERECPRT